MKALKNINKRQDNWKKYPYLFNECKNLVFECQCGKKYESFPGLYLHFQRKHDKKISTKFNPNQCKIIKEATKITYKYILQEKRCNSQKQTFEDFKTKEKQQISSVLFKFIRDSKDSIVDNQQFLDQLKSEIFLRRTVSEFQIYIFSKLEQNFGKQSLKDWLYKIPTFFNNYVQELMLDTNSAQYRKVCIVLFYLAKWLRQQGHSELIVEFADYSTNSE